MKSSNWGSRFYSSCRQTCPSATIRILSTTDTAEDDDADIVSHIDNITDDGDDGEALLGSVAVRLTVSVDRSPHFILDDGGELGHGAMSAVQLKTSPL